MQEFHSCTNSGRGFGGQSSTSDWVATNCAVLPGFDTSTQNFGAPDGTRSDRTNGDDGFARGPTGAMQVTLYACGREANYVPGLLP